MPHFKKSRDPIEISELLDENSADNPISHLFNAVHKRNQLEFVLHEALQKLDLGQLMDHISLGEISPDGDIKLITQKAGVLSKLKNKLPSLLHYFRESGFPLKAIHLKVSPKPTSIDVSVHSERIESVPIQFSAQHQESWEKLLNELDKNSPAFMAVKKLLLKHR